MSQIFIVVFISLLIASTTGAQTSADNPDDESVCAGDQRTVLSIIWSCLATIFACTWVAVHPNVPGRDITTKGATCCALERLKIWSMTILAPEVIVAWAAEQFIVAWKLRHGKYKTIAVMSDPATEEKETPKLTLAHGFLVSMGGLYCARSCRHTAASTSPSFPSSLPDFEDVPYFKSEVDEARTEETASSEALIPNALVTLETLECDPIWVEKLAEISLETIEDKSKRDGMSKTFSIIQSSWFILQSVARIIQHLPITLLEMTALAFAGISMITYFLWWYKPLNVKYHIPLHGGSNLKSMTETDSLRHPAHTVTPWWLKFLKFTGWMWYTLMGKPPKRYYMSTENGAPQFYSGTDKEKSKRFMIMVCVGFLFGGFHCLASSFYFPSHAEKLLWRFSSIAVLMGLFAAGRSSPVIMVLEWVAPEWTERRVHRIDTTIAALHNGNIWEERWPLIFHFMSISVIFTYMAARILIIILAFLQLRSLPPLALCTVQWTNVLPHI
ncbi:hypothetical protein IW261DRAFT_1612181 [Armillaria novae-zelandiae]|uniref:Wax synthase domain-containing protein n=1 Tax=Armillaria novae-zelandiae TaxID=153914 RepID=A0AA39TVJ9_9AGAR|nr:hypothetical protein IW261DRAFT_1612181 [Armillaria novae-zelandiae]